MDAAYVWLGVAMVSIALAGIALSVPAQPPPDAGEAATSIDRVAVSGYDASTTIAHSGTEISIGHERIALRNEAGTDAATISFAGLIPLHAVEAPAEMRTTLEGVVAGAEPVDGEVEATLATAVDNRSTTSEWRPTDGVVHARAVTVDGEQYVLVTGKDVA